MSKKKKRILDRKGKDIGWEIDAEVVQLPTIYITRFRAAEFKADVLTDVEFDALLDWYEGLDADKSKLSPADKKASNAVRRLIFRNGWVDVTDPKTVSLAEFALAKNIIQSRARRDQILLGLASDTI